MSSDLNHNVTQKARTLRIITLFLPLVTIAFTVPLIVIQFRPFPFVGVIPQIAATLLAIVELVPFPKFTGKRYQYRILLPIDDEQEHQHLRPKYQSRLIVILLDAVVAISILIICIVWWTTNPGRYNRSNGVLASYGTVSLLASLPPEKPNDFARKWLNSILYMAEPRAFLLVLILLFLFLSPEPQQGPLGQRQYELSTDIAQEQVALNVLSSSQYGDFSSSEEKWLNLTGLKEHDGFVWSQLPRIQERSQDQTRHALGDEDNETSDVPARERYPLYHNITGFIRGKWARSKSEENPFPQLKAGTDDKALALEYNRNISGTEGNVRFRFSEEINRREEGLGRHTYPITAHMAIQDDNSYGDGWELTLYGIHFYDTGRILLTTTSDKFTGIFALPHFAWSESTFDRAKQTLNQTLRETIDEQKTKANPMLNPWTSTPDTDGTGPPKLPNCEMLVYLQQYPVLSSKGTERAVAEDNAYVQTVEEDLRFPIGLPMPFVPHVKMAMTAFSPDCGFVLESKGPPDFAPLDNDHLEGSKVEVILKRAKKYTLAFAAVLGSQLLLSMRQMKDASTPSTRSRISFYTIAALAMGDGFACLTFLTLAVFLEPIWLVSTTTAFLAFLSVSFFGMRFLMDIWSVQSPERRRQQVQDARNSTPPNGQAEIQNSNNTDPPAQNAPTVPAAAADTLPLPVTARQAADSGATPIILPPDQDGAEGNTNATGNITAAPSARQEFGALYTRFCLLLLFISFLSINATSWPTTLRSAYSNVLAFIYLSFWCPQIYRNIMRNCRKALRWEFIIGQSILRLTPILYFYTIPDNVPFVENDIRAALILVGWVWIQIVILASQEIIGPRFFIREGWAPPAYDYHPIIREDEEGATMPIGFTQATEEPDSPTSTKHDSKGQRVFDCAICMQDIEVPIVAADGTSNESGATSFGSGLLTRRAYMMTPCRHIFHTPCLEGWMRYRLQCPICRETLPPL
ncbi:MAG: mitofusin [Bogoriella megaspora]|nr:MAG: mitofusin [Bogoriella megaspora]